MNPGFPADFSEAPDDSEEVAAVIIEIETCASAGKENGRPEDRPVDW